MMATYDGDTFLREQLRSVGASDLPPPSVPQLLRESVTWWSETIVWTAGN